MASFDNDPALDLFDYYKIKAAGALTAMSFLLPVYNTYPQPHAPTPQTHTHTHIHTHNNKKLPPQLPTKLSLRNQRIREKGDNPHNWVEFINLKAVRTSTGRLTCATVKP